LAENKQKGPSLSSLAALTTLAIALWTEVDLAVALFRAIAVFLVLSLLTMAYRVVMARFLAISQEKAQRELLEKVQFQAEEEEAKRQEERKKREEERKMKNAADAAKPPPNPSADG